VRGGGGGQEHKRLFVGLVLWLGEVDELSQRHQMRLLAVCVRRVRPVDEREGGLKDINHVANVALEEGGG
jgi:hypothetical protein